MLRVIELFAGIGSQTRALKNIGVEHEVIAISEIDKHAIKSYEAIHGPVNNLGDIKNIESLPDADLWTYSFPCQDISNARVGKGFSRDSNTRSGLLWEVERLLNCSARPKYLLMENVPMLLSERYKKDFARWVRTLSEIGYMSFYDTLNSKDFDVPQDRNRVFMVSTLNGDVFTFPKPVKQTKKLKDVLETSVDEKYYISPEKTEGLLQHLKDKDISRTIRTGGHDSATMKHNWDWAAVGCQQVGLLDMKGHDIMKRVYSIEGISPTITACGGGSRERKIIEYFPFVCPDIQNRTQNGRLVREATKTGIEPTMRVRKLTPLECWRLMGFSDEAFYKAKNAGISDTQLYRQAGNSIVVPVLEAIFTEMLKPSAHRQQTLGGY